LNSQTGSSRAERHERASRNEIDLFLLDLKQMHIRLDEPIDIGRAADLITLARRYMLSGHDAAYLDLALRTKLPLATRDGALAAAAERAGVALVQP
jgi:predicted nucleic acid-binding protein